MYNIKKYFEENTIDKEDNLSDHEYQRVNIFIFLCDFSNNKTYLRYLCVKQNRTIT